VLWGLACAGEQGVYQVIEILKRELENVMTNSGNSLRPDKCLTQLVRSYRRKISNVERNNDMPHRHWACVHKREEIERGPGKVSWCREKARTCNIM
jgi:hypothetical protein